MPKVSVVTAVYNAEKFLPECLDSILNQTFEDFEFILVDDCSSDSSPEILREYAKKDQRIRLIFNEENSLPAATRNRALDVSQGEYIAIMDCDDLSMPTRFEKQVEYLDQHKDVALVGSFVDLIDESGTFLKASKPPTHPDEIASKLPKTNCFTHSSVMYRKTEGIRYRNKLKYSHDYDLYLQFLARGLGLANIEEVLTKHRVAQTGIGETKTIKQFLFAEKARKFYEEKLRTGKDSYDTFSPDEVMNIDEEKLMNQKNILVMLIHNALSKRDAKKTRIYTARYQKNFGSLNKYAAIGILARMPRLFHLALFVMGKSR